MGMIQTGHFECEKLSTDFPELIESVVEYGGLVTSRIGATKEVVNLNLRLWNPAYCIIGRENLSMEFLEMEAMMLLAGIFDEELIREAVPRAADLLSTATAYGPRTVYQLRRVVEELSRQVGSRRAVVYVGRHDDLFKVNDPQYREQMKAEMPCTMTWQFLIRDGLLHMIVNMRSWDLVWGLSYDVPSFVSVQMMLAAVLKCGVGAYLHNAGSAHVYDRHWDMKMWSNTENPALRHDWLLRLDTIHQVQEAALQWVENKRKVLT